MSLGSRISMSVTRFKRLRFMSFTITWSKAL
jgi:hypothetical protein